MIHVHDVVTHGSNMFATVIKCTRAQGLVRVVRPTRTCIGLCSQAYNRQHDERSRVISRNISAPRLQICWNSSKPRRRSTGACSKQLHVESDPFPFTVEELVKDCKQRFFASFDFTLRRKTAQEVADFQKNHLGILYKRNLPTNPTKNESYFEPRWAGTTMPDKAMAQLFEAVEKYETSTVFCYVLQAASGAGKTGAIFNLSEKAFLFYTECGGRQSVDFVDYPYLSLQLHIDGILEKKMSKVQKSTCIIQSCTLFWLAKAIALKILLEHNKALTPRDWMYWTTNDGSKIIAAFQEYLLNDCFKHYNLPASIQRLFLVPLLHNCKVWLVVDNAQFVAANQVLSLDYDVRSLLGALVLYSCPLHITKKIIAGNGPINVTQNLKSPLAKDKSVVYLHLFPVFSPDGVMKYLQENLALDEVWKQSDSQQQKELELLLERISETLQGRPYFTMNFMALLVQKAGRPSCAQAAINALSSCFDSAVVQLKSDCFATSKNAKKAYRTKKRIMQLEPIPDAPDV